MKRIIAAVLAAVLAAGCGTSDTGSSSAEQTAPPVKATATTTPATTKPTPTTEANERLQHWREVVQGMSCAELADLETKRLAVQFNDQLESLVAIHDRQAKLHC